MKRKIAFFSIFLIAANIFALGVPELNERVCDYGGILNARQKVEITDYLERLEQTSGIQIGVLTVSSLKGDSIERFSMKAAEKWKLGQNKKDNGALLVVALAERCAQACYPLSFGDKCVISKHFLCFFLCYGICRAQYRRGDEHDGTHSLRNYIHKRCYTNCFAKILKIAMLCKLLPYLKKTCAAAFCRCRASTWYL